jgi:hypothetical protein
LNGYCKLAASSHRTGKEREKTTVTPGIVTMSGIGNRTALQEAGVDKS